MTQLLQLADEGLEAANQHVEPLVVRDRAVVGAEADGMEGPLALGLVDVATLDEYVADSVGFRVDTPVRSTFLYRVVAHVDVQSCFLIGY
ncbi:MAG: hypothetical protein ACKO0Z_21340 [Betaproteobacteria bacterium]